MMTDTTGVTQGNSVTYGATRRPAEGGVSFESGLILSIVIVIVGLLLSQEDEGVGMAP